MKDYSSPQSPALATRESFCFTAEDQTHARDPTDGLNLAIFIILVFIVFLLLLVVLNCWFGNFVVVYVFVYIG